MAIKFLRASSQYGTIIRPNIDTTPATLAIWYKFTSHTDLVCFCGNRSGTTYRWYLYWIPGSPDRLQMTFAKSGLVGGLYSTGWTPTDGVWYCIVIKRYGGLASRYFVNGVQYNQAGTSGNAANFYTSSADGLLAARISDGSPVDFCDGTFAAWAWWNRSLSDEECYRLYCGGRILPLTWSALQPSLLYPMFNIYGVTPSTPGRVRRFGAPDNVVLTNGPTYQPAPAYYNAAPMIVRKKHIVPVLDEQYCVSIEAQAAMPVSLEVQPAIGVDVARHVCP